MNRTPSGFLSPNQLLIGRYHILRKIGDGGFGAVYKAKDTQDSNRRVAIKEIIQYKVTDQAKKGFEKEAELLSNLQHPHLPSISDFFEEDSNCYLVMDFIEGETLDKYLEATQGRRLPLEEVFDIGIQLCSVLDYLHTRRPMPIIFRDLKPENIMRTPDGHLFLIDFGIARHFYPGKRFTANLGTPGYAAPEQYGNAIPTTTLSDIYGLGVILHQLITGDDPPLVPSLFAHLPIYSQPIPAELDTLIFKMLEENSKNRPARAEDVKEELERIKALLSGNLPARQQPARSPKPLPPQPLIQPQSVQLNPGKNNPVPLIPPSPNNQPPLPVTRAPRIQPNPNIPPYPPISLNPHIPSPVSPYSLIQSIAMNKRKYRTTWSITTIGVFMIIGMIIWGSVVRNSSSATSQIHPSSTPTSASLPTPISTPSTAPSPIPTDTPTPPPVPGTVLYDSRSDNYWQGWGVQGQQGHWNVIDNQLVNDGKGTPPLIAPYNPGQQNITNYTVVAKITRIRYNSDQKGSFGIVVRKTSDTDGYTFAICFEAEHSFGIGFTCASQTSYEALLFYDQDFPDGGTHGEKLLAHRAFQPPENQEFTYRIDVKGDTITAYIDDQLVLGPVRDAHYVSSGGQVGIWSSDCQISVNSVEIIAA